MGTGSICMYIGTGVGSCLTVLMLISNIVAAVRYLTSEGTEPASPASLAAWGVSVASFFLGPCGFLTALIAVVLARVERAKVFREEASAWSLMPCSMANTNSFAFVVVTVIIWVGIIAGFVI
jgi:hypothetical protein